MKIDIPKYYATMKLKVNWYCTSVEHDEWYGNEKIMKTKTSCASWSCVIVFIMIRYMIIKHGIQQSMITDQDHRDAVCPAKNKEKAEFSVLIT